MRETESMLTHNEKSTVRLPTERPILSQINISSPNLYAGLMRRQQPFTKPPSMVHVYSADSEDAKQTRSKCLAIHKHHNNAIDFASTLQVLIIGLNQREGNKSKLMLQKLVSLSPLISWFQANIILL